MPYKVWAVNEILTAADMNTYVGNQTILSFAGTAARTSAIGTPVEGMLSYVGSGVVEVYAGTATGWTTISGGGGAGVTVGTAAPVSPSQGDLWWDSDDGKLFLYYDDGTSQQFVDAAGPSVAVQPTAPTGYEGQLWLDSTDGSMYTYYTDPGGTASSWIGAVSRSGGILQVVSTTKTDVFSSSQAAYGLAPVTGLTASITPRSTSSKILVQAVLNGSRSSNYGAINAVLTKDGSTISGAVGDAATGRTSITGGDTGAVNQDLNTSAQMVVTYLDSPSTTSTVEYGVSLYNSSTATQSLYLNRTASDPSGQPYGTRTISTITVMEIAG